MRYALLFLLFILVACGPHDITIDGLRTSPKPPNLNYHYNEMNQHVQSTPMRTRTIVADDAHYVFQYCTVNDKPQVCGEVNFSTDTSLAAITELIYTYGPGDAVEKTEKINWTYSGRRSYLLLEEVMEVYKYDAASSYVGCNTMFWNPKLGIIFWTNFMHTLHRTTELREHEEKGRLLNLLTAKVRQDKDFFEGCAFVNRIMSLNTSR